MVEYKVLTTTLPSGTNTAIFTDALIGSNTKIDVYTSDDDTIIEKQEQSGTTVTITVSNHSNALGMALVINNVEEYEPIDIEGIEQDILHIKGELQSIPFLYVGFEPFEELSNKVSNIDGDVASLQADILTKQDTLIPGENITIIDNVISASGGSSTFNYDTLYNGSSATGDWINISIAKEYKAIIIASRGANDTRLGNYCFIPFDFFKSLGVDASISNFLNGSTYCYYLNDSTLRVYSTHGGVILGIY